MRPEELTIVYKLDTFAVELALEGIQAVLAGDGFPLGELYGEPMKLTKALARLKRAKRKTFNIVGGGFEFDLSCLRNFQLDFLTIKATGDQCPSWDKWAAWFIGNPNFVMGWLADVEYEYWQNAEDLLQYTSEGKPHEHLPKKSNGLPPPVEQTIIDISGNPGRRILRNGYCEVVGAVMWFGEPFWELTTANKVEIERSQWLQFSKPCPTVVRIEASAKCFTTAEGASGELQRTLRALLYPRHSKVL